MKPGAKYYEWEARGAPFRLELGPRDLANQSVMLARRLGGKEAMPIAGLAARLEQEMLDDAARAVRRRRRRARKPPRCAGPKSKQEFIDFIEGNGGFVYAGFCGDPAVEAEIKAETKATIRCLPMPEFRSAEAPTTCIWTGRPATVEAVWARAY